MDAAVTSGLFALSGVALAGIGGWTGAYFQHRWGREDAKDLREADIAREREARMFDHKRVTYLALLDAVASATPKMISHRKGTGPWPSLEDLNHAITSVQVFGSSRVSAAANSIWLNMWKARTAPWSPVDGLDAHDIEIAHSERELLNAIREDLGIAGEIVLDPPSGSGLAL